MNIEFNIAASNDRPEIVEILLEHGADSLHKNDFSLTPKKLAMDYGTDEIKKLIKDSIKLKNKNDSRRF